MVNTPASAANLLTLLRVALHVMFATLLLFAMISAINNGNHAFHAVCVLGTTVLLGGLYLAGTVLENRGHQGRTSIQYARWVPVWLVAVVGIWALAVILSPAFIWLMFPLVFVVLHCFPGLKGIAAVGLLWAMAAFLPLIHQPTFTFGQWFGPLIGASFAVVIHHVYSVLSQVAAKNEAIALELLDAQAQLSHRQKEAGRMEERERLSREIHDTVAQGLSSIVLLSRAAEHSATGETAHQLRLIHDQAQEGLDEARRFVRDLASPKSDQPLDQALEDLAQRTMRTQAALQRSIDISVAVLGQQQALPEPILRTALRVAQEGIHNVIKHSDATKVVITQGIWEHELSLDIVDNGSNATGSVEGEGFGLEGMARRVELVGGSLLFEPNEHGSTLACRLPLTSKR
ncbi:histidine kinase [Corynebacterium pseudopelargi]|uniref:histidine kinase n=1 Tax=Corynebacterium pseudopelargi TaxID=2080757 RepID=A0A3G6IXA0_9CORY|nr:histidine kinase [Corynebacterium pseudopelargi]AZA10287.1 Sensor histidine kinase LiaS [Corynebacterium pseudopelargi]